MCTCVCVCGCAGVGLNVYSYSTDTCTSQPDHDAPPYLWWTLQNTFGHPLPPGLQQEHKVPVEVDKDVPVPRKLNQ